VLGITRAQLLGLALPGIAVLALFFALPLAVVVAEAARGGGEAFLRIAVDAVFWRGLRGSLVLSLSSSTVSLGVGFLVALNLSRMSPNLRTLLMFCISLPLSSWCSGAPDSSRCCWPMSGWTPVRSPASSTARRAWLSPIPIT
jgi:ABC-type spermidine/putrescine transport system permease subunit I